MKNKYISLLLTLVLIFCTFSTMCIANAENGGYGDNSGSVKDTLTDILLESSEYPVKGGYIYAYPGMGVAQLIKAFTPNGSINVYNGESKMDNNALVFSGNIVKLSSSNVVIDAATLAVLGDLNANGQCTVSDIVTAINGMVGGIKLEKLQTVSADINRSGTLTVTDVVNMRNLILKSADYKGLSPETGMYATSQYVAAAYDSPMWAGNIVYQENAVVQQNASGGIDDIALLYKIDEIVEIRNYGLDKVYEEGKDYVLTADGKIRIPQGSTITSASVNAFLDPVQNPSNWLNTPNGVIVSYGTNIHRYQISVTYTHSDSWGGYIPENQSSKLDRFYNKLANGEEVNMLFYGDSISTGLNASGCNEALKWKYDGSKGYSVYNENYKESINVAPYAASWPRAVYNRTAEMYPNAKINYINVASSSSNSTTHGTRNLQAAVIDNNPDIVFIAFGTNESGLSKANYKTYQKTMLEGITRVHPDCAIVFVSPTVPNLNKYGNNNFAAFEEAFYELQAEYPQFDIAVAPVYKVATYVNSIKKYQDVSGNNINHPNDFGVRIYGNTIMQTIGLY